MFFAQRCSGVKAVASPFKILEMFTKDTIEVFQDLIGWRQNELETGVQLTRFTAPTGILFFNDVSAYLSFDNLVSIAPNYNDKFNGDSAKINEAFTNWIDIATKAAIFETLEQWKGLKANRTICDYNDFVIKYKSEFQLMIWYNVGIKFLLQLCDNPNAKINQVTMTEDTRTNILFKIHGDTSTKEQQKQSLEYKYNAALNNFCIPKRTRGIKLGAM